MRVIPIVPGLHIYSSNVYLVLGDWSRLEDVNALVDVGRCPDLIGHIEQTATGVGKRKVELVVLTHSHYDHVEMLPRIRERYHPRVCALSATVEGVDWVLRDGDQITLGDLAFDVIAIHGHTEDSLCLYNRRTGVLFSGDAPLMITSPGGSYEPEFAHALALLARRDVRMMYPGHGDPIDENCKARLKASLGFVRESVKRAGNGKGQTDEVV